MAKRVCLGKITSAHGVKGLVKILPFGEDPSLIQSLGPAYTAADGAAQTGTLVITLKNPAGRHLLAAIDGVTDRDAAEALRGVELYYDRALLPETDTGEYYYDDLIGLTAIENGQTIGTVKAVQNFGAGDLLDIKPAAGGPSFYLPYANEYVDEVDLNAKTITVINSQSFQTE